MSKQTIKEISDIKEDCLNRIASRPIRSRNNCFRLLTLIFTRPYFDSGDIVSDLNVSKPTASRLIQEFVDMRIITPTNKAKRRYVTYRFDCYVDILEKGTSY